MILFQFFFFFFELSDMSDRKKEASCVLYEGDFFFETIEKKYTDKRGEEEEEVECVTAQKQQIYKLQAQHQTVKETVSLHIHLPPDKLMEKKLFHLVLQTSSSAEEDEQDLQLEGNYVYRDGLVVTPKQGEITPKQGEVTPKQSEANTKQGEISFGGYRLSFGNYRVPHEYENTPLMLSLRF